MKTGIGKYKASVYLLAGAFGWILADVITGKMSPHTPAITLVLVTMAILAFLLDSSEYNN